MRKVDVIILAAGISSVDNKTMCKPLMMLPNKRTIINQMIQSLRKRRYIHNIIVVSGYEADSLQNELNDSVIIKHNPNFYKANIVESFKVGLEHTENDCIVIPGDKIFFRDNLRSLIGGKSSLGVHPDIEGNNKTIGVYSLDGKAINLYWGLSDVWYGITYLTGSDIRSIVQLLNRRGHFSNWYLFEIINALISFGMEFDVTKLVNFREINSRAEAKRHFNQFFIND